jgi:hypothetical protein
MPIDFAAIVEPFREPLTRDSKALVLLFTRIGLRIDKLADAAEAAERASRALPVLEFLDDALVVRLEVSPADRLVLGADGLVDGIVAGGRDFVSGLRYVPTAIESELAMMNLVAVPAAALGAVADSLARFQTASPELFDPRDRRLMDVFGIAGLVFRALAEDPDQLQLLLVRTITTVKKNAALLDRGSGGAAPSTGGTSALDALGPAIAEVALLLPILPEVLIVALDDVLLPLQAELLATFREIAGDAYALRQIVLTDVLLKLDLLSFGAVLLDALQDIVVSLATPLASAIPAITHAFSDGLRKFFDALKAWADWIVVLVRIYADLSEALLDTNLSPIGTYTVRDLLDKGASAAGSKLREGLKDAADQYAKYRYLKSKVTSDPALTADQQAGYHELIDALLTLRDPGIGDAAGYSGGVGFPDLWDGLLSGGRGAKVIDAVDRFGTTLRSGVTTSLEGASASALAVGDRFRKESDSVALGGRALAIGLGSGPAAMAAMAFGGERPSAGTDPLALAWDELVARGGFALVAAALPVYVEALRAASRARRPPPDADTSPHLLLRRARAHGMHLSEIVVHADVATLDGKAVAGAVDAVAAAIAAQLGDRATEAIYAAAPAGAAAGGGR